MNIEEFRFTPAELDFWGALQMTMLQIVYNFRNITKKAEAFEMEQRLMRKGESK